MRSEHLIESSTDGIFAFNKNLQLTICNKKVRTFFGIKKETCINNPLLNTMDFVDAETMSQVLAGDTVVRKDNNYFVNKDNTYIQFDLELTPVLNDKEEIVGGMGILRDIQSVEDSAPTDVNSSEDSTDYLLPKIVFDLKGNPIFFNDSYRRLWNITPKVERYVLDHYNLFKDEQLSAYGVTTIFKDQETKGCVEMPLIRYDTRKTTLLRALALKQKILSGYIQPQRNKKGEINSIEVTLLDRSLDKSNEKIYSSFYEKFQKFTKNLPGVIFEHVQQQVGQNHFRYIRKNCLDIFGLSDIEIQNDSRLLKNLIHADDIVSYLQSVKKAEEEFTKWEWEGRFIVAGEEKWIRGISRPEKEGGGRIVRYGMLTDVTAEKTALINEGITAKRLHLALQGGNLGLWDWYLNTGEIVTNDRFVEIIGYHLEELRVTDNLWLDRVHEDERQLVRDEMIQHIKGQSEFFDIEMRVRTIDDAWQWIHTRGQVTEWNEKRALRITGTIQNIDKRKVNEHTLSESESRYRDLIEHSPLAITVHSEGKIVFANEQSGKLLGAENSNQLIGRNALDFIHKDHQELSKKRMSAIYTNGETAPMVEEKFVRMDGKEVIVEVVGIPYKYEGKRAIQVIARDVTENRNTEGILKRSEQLLSQLFENVPIGIVLLDEKRRVIQINKGFEGIFGYDNNEAFGKKLNDLIIPRESRGESINLTRLITKGEVVKEIETTRKTKDGRLVPVMIYGLPVKLKDKVIAVYGIYVDVTASKNVEGELKIRNEELDNFVYKVSHDLRAPLSSTLGLIHLAKLEGNNADLKQYIDLIENRVTQLDRFIADVLSHSKNLNVEVVNSKIDFNQIIHDSFEELDYLPGADTIKREISIDSTAFVNDHWRVSEVLRNLISNAIKYLNPEIDDPYIKIHIKIDSKSAEINFEDNGIGIAEDLQVHVFEMFYRATEFSEGSGIGLYIVKNAIIKMGGEIRLESTQYQGTKFHISLPNK